MRKDRRRALWVAACATTALAGCGGGGGVLAPPAPPGSPIPTTAGTYFQIARAGGSGTAPTYNLNFAPSAMPTQVGTSGFQLVYVDSASPPLAFNLTNVQGTNQLQAQGLGVDLGTFSEYFPASGGGTATSWGTRYRLYADVGPNGTGAGTLYAVDLRKPAGTTTPPPPVQVQVSNATVGGAQLCAIAPGIFDNYRSANLSWIVFHAQGPDGDCGSLDDNYVGFQLSMTSTSAPLKLGQLEAVEPLYDTFGTIIGYLAINHPPVVGGVPSAPVPLQQLNASFANPKTFTTTLGGTGLNTAGGDFRSLGVLGNVWLYVDASGIFALNWSSGVATGPIYPLAAGDSVQGRAVFDGTNAYVAINNAAGSYVLMINTTNDATTKQAPDTANKQITLVGVTSSQLIYLFNDGTAVKSLAKATLTGLTSLWTSASASQTVDSLMGPGGASGPPVAFLVGNTLFFTVADTSASGTTGFAKQAFYVAAGASSATSVASSVSAVLGVVAPATIPTSSPITYTGALVLTGGRNYTTGVAAFAYGGPQSPPSTCTNTTPAFGATLALYTTGTASTTIGALSGTNVANVIPLCAPITGAALNAGPVQAAIPATLLLFGKDGTGANAQDIAIFSSDNSTSFMQLSGFAQ